jgi:O-antigen ligase
MLRDHPFLGVGLDNFLYHYRTTYILPTAWQEFNLSHPHNVILDFWLRLGLPGLLLAAWLSVSFFRTAWRRFLSLRSVTSGSEGLDAEAVNGSWLILGLMAGMVYSLAHGLVDQSFFLVDLSFGLMLMLALVQEPLRRGPHGIAGRQPGRGEASMRSGELPAA